MGVIKLQNVGESLTATITTAERVQGQYGEQVRFTMPEGDLYVPMDSALRQLKRIPLAIEECVGETLVFSRDPNDSRPGAKPYWGIRVAGGADKAPQPSKRLSYTEANAPAPRPTTTAPVGDVTAERVRVAQEYLDLLTWVKAQDKTLTPDAAQAAAATIWITWGQMGLRSKPQPKPEPAKVQAKPQVQTTPPHDFSDFPPEPVDDEALPF